MMEMAAQRGKVDRNRLTQFLKPGDFAPDTGSVRPRLVTLIVAAFRAIRTNGELEQGSPSRPAADLIKGQQRGQRIELPRGEVEIGWSDDAELGPVRVHVDAGNDITLYQQQCLEALADAMAGQIAAIMRWPEPVQP